MSGVILLKRAGKKIPDALVDKLLPAYTNCIGAATKEGSELKFVHSEEGADKDIFKLIQEDFKDNDVFFYMADGKAKRTAIDLQPYPLLRDAKGNPLLMGFLTGNFDKWKSGGNNSPEWFAVESDILPRIRDTFDICGSDIAKTMERIKTNVLFQRDITNLWTDNGTVVFLAVNGDYHVFEHNPKKLDAEWGFVTNAHDYVEGVHETAATGKKFSLENFRRVVADVVSPDKKPADPPKRQVAEPEASPPARRAVEAPPATSEGRRVIADPPATAPTKPAEPAAEPTPQESELIPAISLTDDEVYYQAPETVTNNKALQAMYRRECGFLPDDWKLRPRAKRSNRKLAIILRDKQAKQVKTVKSLQDIGPALEGKTDTAIPRRVVAETVTGKEKEYPDTGNKNIPDGEVEVALLSAAQKKGLNDFVSDGKIVKMIDKHSKVVVDPSALQAFEEKRPTFTDITGLDMDDMINWPPQVIAMLVKDHPTGAERLITQAIYERHHIKQLLNKKEETAPPTSVPATRRAPVQEDPPLRRRVM